MASKPFGREGRIPKPKYDGGAVRKNDFETSLVKSLNAYFAKREITALAYRFRQSRYSSQPCDVVVDSSDPSYYLGIEAKSAHATTDKLRWSGHFHEADGGQVRRADEFFSKTGRAGYLAVELRERRHRLYFVPWSVLTGLLDSGAVGISIDQIRMYDSCIVKNGVYQLDDVLPLVDSPSRALLKTTRLTGFKKKKAGDR